MRTINASAAALFLVLFACVACGGGSSSTVNAATASPDPRPCPSVDPQLALAFPSPSATGVSASLNSVVFIYGPIELTALSGWGNMQLNGISEGALAAAPSPLPSSIPTLGPGQQYLAAAVTTPLAAHTAYRVTFAFTNGCVQADSAAPGTFTTQ